LPIVSVNFEAKRNFCAAQRGLCLINAGCGAQRETYTEFAAAIAHQLRENAIQIGFNEFDGLYLIKLCSG